MSHALRLLMARLTALRSPSTARSYEIKDFRHRVGVFLSLVENLLVQLQLHQGIQEIVLLGSDVDAVEHPQHLALGYAVSWPQLAVFRLAGLGMRSPKPWPTRSLWPARTEP